VTGIYLRDQVAQADSLFKDMPTSQWRLLTTPPASGAENMALDEALMSRARASREWTFRVYSWSTPTISLGRNQTAVGRYDLARIAERNLAIVRRPTGGRAILHDREITYSVTAPADDDSGDLMTSYERINRILLDGLARVGVRAAVADVKSRASLPGMAPCFDEPSFGELVLDGRKLAGSAQWRSDGALLQHGSILIEDDQSVLAELAVGSQRPIPVPATLAGALGMRPRVEDMASAFTTSVRMLEDPNATVLEIDDELRAQAAGLVVRYLDDEWTWRK
jgi:lipoate-protein ligase A